MEIKVSHCRDRRPSAPRNDSWSTLLDMSARTPLLSVRNLTVIVKFNADKTVRDYSMRQSTF